MTLCTLNSPFSYSGVFRTFNQRVPFHVKGHVSALHMKREAVTFILILEIPYFFHTIDCLHLLY